MAQLLSVNVGLPRDIEWNGRTVRTGIWKDAVPGRRRVDRLNLEGDGQGDLAGHGGEQRAVLVYQVESYSYWQEHLKRADFVYGQFGENFTVKGLPDGAVCIGDRYQIGSAVFEVTQPRVTCYRVGIRLSEPRMPALLTSSGRPGFYLRVLQEGEVGVGDEITKVADGPERMTVAAINALLYLPSHPRDQLERALSIPALSAGWQSSLRSLLAEQVGAGALTGNPGLAPPSGPPPAWAGFRRLRVAQIDHESRSVVSLTLVSADLEALAVALPGQFVVLRLQTTAGAPALLRSYSLSGAPSSDHYRVSVKREVHGAAGTFLHNQVRVGDTLEVSAPRGGFTLRPGDGPVVLLSAGVGATPVLAMLHTLAATASPRDVWWLHGARNRDEHPFADEVRRLLQALPHGHSHVQYSQPHPGDRPGIDFDAAGHLDMSVLRTLEVRSAADFYLCGPPGFLRDLTAGLQAWGVSHERVRSENFGPGESATPGVVALPRRAAHVPDGPPGSGPRVVFARSGLSVNWSATFGNLLECAEACDVPARWSCRTGVCHRCESGLISGSVVYEPQPLEGPARGNLLICCSQPQDDIVIDL